MRLLAVILLFILELRFTLGSSNNLDVLTPYPDGEQARKYSTRTARDCSPVKYANKSFEVFPSENDSKNDDRPIVETKILVTDIGSYSKRTILSHVVIVRNPSETVSILEPTGVEGGCSSHSRSTVLETAAKHNCLLAVNGGLFNTQTGACNGNVVSNGKIVQAPGLINAHFGITMEKQLIFGYLSQNDVESLHFHQLVGGVVWLVRDGQVYVGESETAECSSTEETGSLERFITVISARTAVGHDASGRLIIVQVDGQTDRRGINLWELANLMKELGAVNAINLDGGGSSTLVINGTLVNYPSDMCDGDYRCARNVSTVLCVHESRCNCSDHGECVRGQCHCRGVWTGPQCQSLQCGASNCSNHGLCTPDGCQCLPGWMSPDCSQKCDGGRFGVNCSSPCRCLHAESCSTLDGTCFCERGFYGVLCDQQCPAGFFGRNCSLRCQCSSCYCDPYFGSCHESFNDSIALTHPAVSCLWSKLIDQQEQHDSLTVHLSKWTATLILISIIASISCTANVILFALLKKRRDYTQIRTTRIPLKLLDAQTSDYEGDDSG